jgi:hypothetical protein
VQRLQELLDTTNTQQEACNRVVGVGVQADLPDGNLQPRREYRATSRSPSDGGSNQNGVVRSRQNEEPVASRIRRSHETVVDSRLDTLRTDGLRQQEDCPPLLCRERPASPTPFGHPTLVGWLVPRETIGENDACHRIK